MHAFKKRLWMKLPRSRIGQLLRQSRQSELTPLCGEMQEISTWAPALTQRPAELTGNPEGRFQKKVFRHDLGNMMTEFFMQIIGQRFPPYT